MSNINKKTRVVILADPIDEQNAGVHVYLKGIINELKTRLPLSDLEFIFIHSRSNPFWQNLKTYKIPDLPHFPGWTTLRKFFLIPLLIRLIKADIVWEPAHFGPFFLRSNIQRVTTIHDLTPILFPQYHKRSAVWLHRLFLKRILKMAAKILVNSNHTKRDLVKYYPPAKSKIAVIPLAVDTAAPSTITPSSLANATVLKAIKSGYFLFVSTIEPRKGILTLLAAFSKFKDQTGLPHKLVLVGAKGWHTGPIFAAIQSSPHIADIFVLGHVSDPYRDQLYKSAEALIYPSVYEGFGLPILEAMSLGTPCLVAKNSSLPEVGGSAALYFKTGAADQLCDLMKKLTATPQLRKKLISSGHNQAAKFSWPKHVDKLLQELSVV